MSQTPIVLDELDRNSRDFPSGRELVAIAGFWTVFALLSTTNWLFPPSGQGPPVTARVIAAVAIEPLLWAIVTPPVFWLTSRYSVEGANRLRRTLGYLVLGLLVALALVLAVEWVRRYFTPPPPARANMPSRDRSVWDFARVRLLNQYMVFGGVLSVGVARDYFRRYQRRLEESARLRAQLAEARLTALQNQLNPHFLFNTLNAVATLVDRDPRGVRRMIARLSDLLRATLEPSAEQEAPLAREMALTEKYLEILEIRFQGRLQTSLEVPPDVRDALVPPLVLQPLIENAMKHAVSRTSEPSRIQVRVTRAGEQLVLTVEDTGPGSAASRADEDTSGTGIGLANTRARLAQLYGNEQSLTLDDGAAGGTIVTIRLPFHTSADLRATPAAAD
jgi:two-component system, LytTR family, sensor kinase